MNTIDISLLSNNDKANLVCFYYAHFHKNDTEYKQCFKNLNIIGEYYCIKPSTLKNRKDAYDPLFETNGRKGWNDRPLRKRDKSLYRIYEKYKDYDLATLKEAVDAILEEVEGNNEIVCFSLKTKDPATVNAIKGKNQKIEFCGINVLKEILICGSLVFVVFGGDNPPWETGLAGIGVISKEPYDEGYDSKNKKNFKIQVDIVLLLERPLNRENLISYKDTYGTIGVAPVIKWEPNQAISRVKEKNALAVLRAILDYFPNTEKTISSLVDPTHFERIIGATTRLIPVSVYYHESIEDAQKSSIIDVDDNENFDHKSCDEYCEQNFIDDVFFDEKEYEMMKTLLERKKNILLQGAPGVGKTFVAERLAYSLIGKKDHTHIKMIQFHQSYSYEDFVIGYKPTETGFDLKKGPFYTFCRDADNAYKKDKNSKYFFIIDEINRGNLSKIFGELLMLIEADKRGKEITLLYNDKNNETFSVPDNVYIIGMMNTADRSIALIDYALRRRFSFYTIRPAFESEKFLKYIEGSCEKTYTVINAIKEINEQISKDDTLGEGFQIGHSYFCNSKPIDEITLKTIIDFEIIPLIKEYWFDEPETFQKYKDKLIECLK